MAVLVVRGALNQSSLTRFLEENEGHPSALIAGHHLDTLVVGGLSYLNAALVLVRPSHQCQERRL